MKDETLRKFELVDEIIKLNARLKKRNTQFTKLQKAVNLWASAVSMVDIDEAVRNLTKFTTQATGGRR